MKFFANDLILRTVTESDIDEIVKMWAYPEVTTVDDAFLRGEDRLRDNELKIYKERAN